MQKYGCEQYIGACVVQSHQHQKIDEHFTFAQNWEERSATAGQPGLQSIKLRIEKEISLDHEDLNSYNLLSSSGAQRIKLLHMPKKLFTGTDSKLMITGRGKRSEKILPEVNVFELLLHVRRILRELWVK